MQSRGGGGEGGGRGGDVALEKKLSLVVISASLAVTLTASVKTMNCRTSLARMFFYACILQVSTTAISDDAKYKSLRL